MLLSRANSPTPRISLGDKLRLWDNMALKRFTCAARPLIAASS
jgi:hypothetical protein